MLYRNQHICARLSITGRDFTELSLDGVGTRLVWSRLGLATPCWCWLEIDSDWIICEGCASLDKAQRVLDWLGWNGLGSAETDLAGLGVVEMYGCVGLIGLCSAWLVLAG